MAHPFSKKMHILCLVIIVLKISLITNDYITIPFKKYQIYKNMQSSTDIFINNYLNNNIYMNIQVGQPTQNVIAKINSLEFELLMKITNKLFLGNLISSFSKEASTTFSIIDEKTDYHFPNSKLVKDNFSFCVNYDINSKKCSNIKKFDNINFIYSEQGEIEGEEGEKTNGQKLSYIEIGLNHKSYYNSNKNKNSLLKNLIKNNYIKNQNWFISFFDETKKNSNENENEDEGIIVFGLEPDKFFEKEYKKDNIVSCQGINADYDYQNNWSIIFQEVKQKTLKADNKDVAIQNNLQGVINFNYDIIVGNNQYMEIIGNTFFWQYIAKGVCKKQLAQNKFYYFECSSLSLSFSEIKENFPSLYFKQNELDYTFELTAQDLFVKIGDQYFFLVVFNKNNPTKSFLLGNVFLKKYFFNFDDKNKKIIFYKEDINDKSDKSEIIQEKVVVHWYNSGKMFVVLIIMIVFFAIFGFYFGRKIYKRRNYKPNELEDFYEYISKDSQKENKQNIEMEQCLNKS